MSKSYYNKGGSTAVDTTRSNFVKKSYFRRLFESLINFIKRTFGFGYGTSKSQSIVQDEGFFEVTISKEMVKALDEKFSDFDFSFSSQCDIVIEIPISLGKQLRAACIEALLKQKEECDEIISGLNDEHKEFREKLRGVSQDIPDWEDIDYVLPYVETYDTFLEDVGVDSVDVPVSVNFYRNKARTHLNEQHKLFRKAQHFLQISRHSEAREYFRKADHQLQLASQANDAAYVILKSQCFTTVKGSTCIDLHGFFVKEALQFLDDFLDECIYNLEETSFEKRSVMVITGRGKHSQDGVPKIKPAVCKRLKQRDLRFFETNPGLLTVDVERNSYLTGDLENSYY